MLLHVLKFKRVEIENTLRVRFCFKAVFCAISVHENLISLNNVDFKKTEYTWNNYIPRIFCFLNLFCFVNSNINSSYSFNYVYICDLMVNKKPLDLPLS